MPNVYTLGSHFPLPSSSQNFLCFGYIQWYASKVCSPHVATSSLWASSRYVLFIIICSSSSYRSRSMCICWMTDLLTNSHKIDSGFHGRSYFSLTMDSCNPFQQPFSERLSSRGPLWGLGCVHLETLPSSGLSWLAEGEQSMSRRHLCLQRSHVILIHCPLARISHTTHQVQG